LYSLKIDILKHKLESRRQHLARGKGWTELKNDKTKLGISLGAAFTGFIISSASSNDGYRALNTGMKTFDVALQQCGRSEWAVSLDRSMLVVPRNHIYTGRSWVTWESLSEALEKLKQKTLAGMQLGNLEAIVSELKLDSGTLRFLVVWVPKQIEVNKDIGTN